MNTYDIIIIGAGASGIFAAGRLTNAHKSVCVIDMGPTPLRKVAISGGGKCNFTNLHADYKHYFGKNPSFTRSALARWTPTDTVDWVKSHKIKIYEKSPGQYFADTSQNIIDALLRDADGATIELNTCVQSAEKQGENFIVKCGNNKTYTAKKLIISTGGMSYANTGTSDIGYKIAKQFGHKIIPPRPALCAIKTNIFDASLSGISIQVEIKIGNEIISDDMLFTHFGLGGPAIYRATVRDLDNGFSINLLPKTDVFQWLRTQKKENGKKQLKTVLSLKLPEHVAEHFAHQNTKNMADYRDTELQEIAQTITNIKISKPDLTTFQTAEITRGGIDTSQISSKTMESALCPGLYFIGECLDIAGDLGGYNLQWAWSSANAIEI